MMKREGLNIYIPEDTMKKALSLAICFVLLIQTAGCSRKPRLTVSYFENCSTSDLELEKKEMKENEEPYGYYDLDSKIDSLDQSAGKVEHYSQVYSKAGNNTIGNLYMIYTDYEQKNDAAAYFEKLSASELSMVEQDPSIHVVKSAEDYLLVLTSKDQLTYTFESLYLRDDVILFTIVLLSALDVSKMDAEWLKKVDKLFDHLRLKSPFALEPKIEELVD